MRTRPWGFTPLPLPAEEPAERTKVELAAECCREILHHVNQAVRDMEDLLRLKDYQRRLDLTHLRQSNDPMLSEFKVNPVVFPQLTLALLPSGGLHPHLLP